MDWWLDVLSVLSNGEMPPADGPELAAADRGQVVEWLSMEVQNASLALRAQGEHSTFRRLARYEYRHALQDLLGLPLRFGEDLPPDPISEDGFQNSSEVLHLSSSQLPIYLEAGREALRAAAPLGDQPATVAWSISMDAAADREWEHQDSQLEGVRKKHEAAPAKLEEELGKLRERFARRPGGAHFQDPAGTRFAGMRWNYNGARFAWAPSAEAPSPPANSKSVAVLPAWHGMTVELGDRVPDEGILRVRVRASRASDEDPRPVSLGLMFGWQASNDSNAVFPVTHQEALVDAPPDAPQTYSWDVPMGDVYPRNLARGVNTMGQLPSPSEFIKLVNRSLSGRTLHIHHVEVEGPVFDQWPPASHRCIFHERPKGQAERAYAAEVIERFMARAWRRTPTRREVSRKVALFRELRRDTGSVEEAVLEVLAVVLTSPNFLYVVVEEPEADPSAPISDLELATRLSLFLWCSAPDEALLERARAGELREPGVLEAEVDRMLADPRAERFADRFVGQWLNLALMDNLEVNRKAYPAFDDRLQDAMVREPVEFFRELLRTDGSALDFIHSDFAMVNERLAAHYGIGDVTGNHFRRVELDPRGSPRRPPRPGGAARHELRRQGLPPPQARDLDAREPPRRSAAAAAARGAGDRPRGPRDREDDAQGAHRGPPQRPGLHVVSRQDRPLGDRLRALRRHRPVAHRGRRPARGRPQPPLQSAGTGRARRLEGLPPPEPPGPVRAGPRPETGHLRPRQAPELQ